MISVANGLTMLLGGARSGKSDLAVRLAETWPGSVTFVATATAGDADMARRIERHQDERPADWDLIEAPLFGSTDIGAIGGDALVIVDCVTLLVSNLLFAERDDPAITGHVAELGAALARRAGPTLAVTNEVGLGIHPETELGRRYRDVLGRANRVLAEHAELSLFVAAGRALRLEEVEPTW
ncbi:MAG: bifunctional adenosylcobinamide kinase/adenosylcobinamide-phosphate guanylyltransferase [Actinomycetota bacterium]